jgi:exosortase/archaeosortase family protein
VTQQAATAHFAGRVILAILVFTSLQIGWQSIRDTSAEYLVIHDGIVVPGVTVVNLLTPRIHAEAIGFVMKGAGQSLAIQNGCAGMEALFLLLAAFCVVSLSPRMRLMGCLLGGVVVFVVNLARILLLFYAASADDTLFGPLDTIFAPITVVLLVGWYFYAWLAYSSRSPAVAP